MWGKNMEIKTQVIEESSAGYSKKSVEGFGDDQHF